MTKFGMVTRVFRGSVALLYLHKMRRAVFQRQLSFLHNTDSFCGPKVAMHCRVCKGGTIFDTAADL